MGVFTVQLGVVSPCGYRGYVAWAMCGSFWLRDDARFRAFVAASLAVNVVEAFLGGAV